jgi:hypothetical protein
MTNPELLKRWHESVAKGRATIARVDATLAAARESRTADLCTAHKSRRHDDDQIIRRDIETDIDPLEQWRRDSDAVTAARERETRARRRIESKMVHEARQHSDAVTTLQSDVAQVSADLLDSVRAVGQMGEATSRQFDDQASAIAILSERLAVAESRAELAETRVREVHDELRRTATELAVVKSKTADLDLALKQAIFDKRVADTAPALRNVN